MITRSTGVRTMKGALAELLQRRFDTYRDPFSMYSITLKERDTIGYFFELLTVQTMKPTYHHGVVSVHDRPHYSGDTYIEPISSNCECMYYGQSNGAKQTTREPTGMAESRQKPHLLFELQLPLGVFVTPRKDCGYATLLVSRCTCRIA